EVVPIPVADRRVTDMAQPSQLRDASRPIDEVLNVHRPTVGDANKKVNIRSVGASNTTDWKFRQIGEVNESGSLGQLVKTLRRGHGLNQIDLAEAIGVARSTIAGIERGHYMPGRETLNALADFFKVSLDELRKVVPPRKVVAGELVNVPDELALLNMWLSMSPATRYQFLLRAHVPHKGDGASN